MRRIFMPIWFVPVLLLISGCVEPYVDNYLFVPRPALAQIPPAPPQAAPPVTVQASIIGIHRDDVKLGIPNCVELRFEIENTGSAPLTFDPQSLSLTNGELLRFTPAILRPPTAFKLAPAQSALLTAYFPFPPGRDYDDTDLESLQLRWLIQIDNRSLGQAVDFHRIYPYYYSPYWYPPPPVFVGGGVVIVHRR